MQPAEHVDAALPTDGGVDSGSAAAKCDNVSGGSGDGSRQTVSAMQPVEHVGAADGSVDGESAAAICDSVSGGDGGGVSRRQSRELPLPPHVSVSVEATAVVSVEVVSVDVAVVSVDESREHCSWWRSCTLLCPPMAVSTVDQLPPRLSVSVEVAVVSVARP